MSDVAIFGVGNMGFTIAHAMKSQGHSLTLVDTSMDVLDRVDIPAEKILVTNLASEASSIIQGRDIVISSLPYHATESLAKACIDMSVPYCDLGGRIDVSANINRFAEEKGFPFVFTDLGLAPGLVNILAEWGYDSLGGADNIKMMVGGLPDRAVKNPLKYMLTWSVDGLINEYRDACKVLNRGNIELVPGMEGLESIRLDKLIGDFEAFYTSGGASHTIQTMKDRGVQNCSYKTLRYKGHRDIVRFLIRECDLPEECLKKIFINGCSVINSNDSFRFSKRIKDIVIVKCQVKSGNTTWDKEVLIDSNDRFSAMQRATGFSIAAVADLIVSGDVEPSGNHLKYADIPFEKFANRLTYLGIDV